MQDVPQLFDRTSPSAHVVSAWGLFVSFSCQCQISLNQQQCGQELFQIDCRVQIIGLWHRIFLVFILRPPDQHIPACGVFPPWR